jgi:hypothetical protein
MFSCSHKQFSPYIIQYLEIQLTNWNVSKGKKKLIGKFEPPRAANAIDHTLALLFDKFVSFDKITQ